MNTKESIKQAGLKLTQPRHLIFQLLCDSKGMHLSAEAIHQRLEALGTDIGFATVYRVLTQFEDAGLVERHHFQGEHAVFEVVHEDHHDHLICIDCGHVEEFVDEVIEEKQLAIAQRLGFECVNHAMTLQGRCLKGKECPRRHQNNPLQK